ARSLFQEASLADLYDPLSMPEPLVRAHDELDRVVASAYGTRRRLDSDPDRLSLLFERYEQLASPLLAAAEAGARRRSRR
ncbi:MAG: type IIL restriction-modification enzyme MmeI, partial [Acidimicrobiales bacterium]